MRDHEPYRVYSYSEVEPLLLVRSRVITKADDWAEAQTTVGMYEWWSPKHILIFKSPNHARAMGGDLMDTSTGKVARLEDPVPW